MKIVAAILFVAGATTLADTVTLKSGEQITGDVLTKTDSAITIRVHNESRTISYAREIPTADVADLSVESAAVKAQRAAHDQLRAYRLDPNQEFALAQYANGIAAFTQFLAKHPDGTLAEDVRQRLTAWRHEAGQVAKGLVKFQSRWMQPDQKKVAAAEAYRQSEIAANRTELAAAQLRLRRLEQDYDTLSRNLAATAANLREAQTVLAGLPDIAVPIVEYHLTTVPFRGRHGYVCPPFLEYEPWVVDEKIIPHPQRVPLQQQIAFYERQVAEGEQRLATLRAEITDLQDRIVRAEERLKSLTS